MVWAFELFVAGSLFAACIVLLYKKPVQLAVILLIVAIFIYPRIEWSETPGSHRTTALGTLATDFSERMFGYYPLDSREEQNNWASSDSSRAIFRSGGISIEIDGNCLEGASVSRNFSSDKGFSINACAGHSGGDGTRFYVKRGKAISAPLFIPPRACAEFFTESPISDDENLTFFPFFSGEIDSEEIILKGLSSVPSRKGTRIDFSERTGDVSPEGLIIYKSTECKSPCRRIIEQDSIVLDYCECREPSGISLDFSGKEGLFLNFLACSGSAESGSAGFSFGSPDSPDSALREEFLLPNTCRRFSEKIASRNFSISKLPSSGTACGDETIWLSEFEISKEPAGGNW